MELGTSMYLDESQLDVSQLTPREQAPPRDDTVIINSVKVDQEHITDTFEDENGDPCSAV